MRDRFLERCAREIAGAQIGDGAFSDGVALWCGTREVAHFHDATGELEVRLTKAVVRGRREELKADARVVLRKNASDWIAFMIGSGRAKARNEADALELVRAAVDANATTGSVGLPPSGADLERRRRFH